GCIKAMKKLSDQEPKAEFESSRGQLRLGVTGLILGVFLTLFFDPFKLLGGPPAVHEAKKWIALCICGIWLPALFGVWFMVISTAKVWHCNHRRLVEVRELTAAPGVTVRSDSPISV